MRADQKNLINLDLSTILPLSFSQLRLIIEETRTRNLNSHPRARLMNGMFKNRVSFLGWRRLKRVLVAWELSRRAGEPDWNEGSSEDTSFFFMKFFMKL